MKINRPLAWLAFFGAMAIMEVVQAAASTDEVLQVGIVYIDPQSETYEPVTIEDVFFHSRCIVRNVPREVHERMAKLIAAAPYGPFDGLRVRLLIDGLEFGRLYVDAEGGVSIPAAGVSKRMDGQSFEEFQAILEPLRVAEKKGHCNARWSANK